MITSLIVSSVVILNQIDLSPYTQQLQQYNQIQQYNQLNAAPISSQTSSSHYPTGPQISVENFLKIQFLGRKITVYNQQEQPSYQANVSNIYKKDNQFFAVVQTSSQLMNVKLTLAVTKKSTLYDQTILRNTRKQADLSQRYKVEQYLNQATNIIANDSDATTDQNNMSSSVNSPGMNPAIPSANYGSFEEIMYYDRESKKTLSGKVITSYNSIKLTDQRPLIAVFEQ